MLHNIPAELRALNQWVVAGEHKIPLTPRTRRKADVTDPATWGTFQEAVSTGLPVGFVFSPDDPYTGIDLDMPLTATQAERHSKILEMVPSYAELSQSGNGVHIIVKGYIPYGVRKDKVEVYSEGRYFICTGNVINHLPINDAQEMLDVLYQEMASTSRSDLIERPETATDAEVVEMGESATNGEKFTMLWRGEWQRSYPSQSEADFAFMAMLAFYSKNNEQCRRLFRESGLGQRGKAQRDKYLNYMLTKIRAHEPPEADINELLANATTHLERMVEKRTVDERGPMERDMDTECPYQREAGEGVSFPEGFVGELAEYFMATAIRPVREIALASALALTAGVVGRSYNISGTGLNQYLILLAKTGSGKEGAAGGINSMVAAVRQSSPMAADFIGPSAFASGQALIRVLDSKPCFVSVLGEFGITLQQVCDPRAPEAKTMLKKVLLDLYAKSGFNQILYPSAYSDSEKNTKLLQAPNITILGESTPETFYGGLDQSHILEGLIPRFTVIEYEGPRPPRNPDAFCPPPDDLVNRFSDLITIATTTKQNNTCCPVPLDEEAQAVLDAFDVYADDQINSGVMELTRNLWNRAHLKALKLAALLAVGVDPNAPTVTKTEAEWAVAFISRDVNRVLEKFTDGDVGTGESKQEHDFRRAVDEYLRMDPDERLSYKTPQTLLGDPVVPYHYLRRRLRLVSSFKHDRRGASVALDALIDNLVKAESLMIMPATQVWDKYSVRTPVYTIGATW